MKIIKNKKGFAMPLAIFFMVFCLAFSVLVVLVSLRLRQDIKTYEEIYDKEINTRFVFDEMGESFFRAVEEHKSEDEIKNAIIKSAGYESEADFPYEIELSYYSNLNSINEKYEDIAKEDNLLEQIQEKLNYEKKATSTFGKIVQNTINGVKNTVTRIEDRVTDIMATIRGTEVVKEPTLEELLDEYSNSMADLKSQYEVKLTHKTSKKLALDVAIGVEYVGGNLPDKSEGDSAYANLSEKYTVLNWSDREVDKTNLPEGFSTLEKVFDSKEETKIEGKEVGVDYDNLLVVRVVNGIINLFR